ncbi:MAG: YdeI/OmpD-associated family protein [Bacteroidales bacterium]|nr:YdeI/OmpD-associated family protein [Bacteroidales bacterium]
MSNKRVNQPIPKESVTFFATQEEFRKWLELNYETASELVVGYYKVKSGKPSMSWSQSVDQALCFGWIDSIRKTIDSESYCIRFTPRRSSSVWSQINIDKVEELTKAGLMKPAGLKAFNLRKEDKSGIYSHENNALAPDSFFDDRFKANPQAWDFFMKQAPSYRKAVTHWIMSGKQETTRAQRLEKLIHACSELRRLT